MGALCRLDILNSAVRASGVSCASWKGSISARFMIEHVVGYTHYVQERFQDEVAVRAKPRGLLLDAWRQIRNTRQGGTAYSIPSYIRQRGLGSISIWFLVYLVCLLGHIIMLKLPQPLLALWEPLQRTSKNSRARAQCPQTMESRPSTSELFTHIRLLPGVPI